MSDKPRWVQDLLAFLIDNITILGTLAYAIYVIYRQEISGLALSTDELLTAILIVLSLLATSEIVQRYFGLKDVQKTSKTILSLLHGRFADRPSALAFFQKLPSMDSYVNGAFQIDLCGVSLTATINKQFSNLRERLKEGAQVNILIADPESLALQMAAARGSSPNDVAYFHKRIEATFNDLDYLQQSWLDNQELGQHLRKGGLAIRLMPYAPSFGIMSFNTNRPHGVMFIEMYPHISYGTQPTFELTLQRDGEWYRHFANQFEQMWKEAKDWRTAPPEVTIPQN